MKPTPLLRKITLLALSLTASAAFAQMRGAAKQTRLWAGPQIGINVSNFYTDSSSLYNKYKTGFMGGVAVNFAFNNTLSVQTEVNYSPKGGKSSFRIDSTSMHGTYAFTYLDVPLILMIKGGEDDNTAFFQIGAQESFLLNAKYSAEIENSAGTFSISNSDVDSLGVPKNDLNLLAGFGMVSTSGWCVTLRAAFGLGDIPDRYNKIITHNMVFSASLGYYFGRKYDVIGGKGRR